jgi:hypothetical protein
MKREPRYPVTINGQVLRAIFTKPAPSDTRSVFTRLLSSLQPVIRLGKKGISFIGVRGKVEF